MNKPVLKFPLDSFDILVYIAFNSLVVYSCFECGCGTIYIFARATPEGSPERALFEQKEVQKFVEWLEDSESDDDESEDEDDH